jgi:hypothetical protein
MRLNVLSLVLLVAGFGSSIGLAQGPLAPASREDSLPAASARATVEICHRIGAARDSFRLIAVSRSAVEAHMRHGDLLAPTSGGCPPRAGGISPPTAMFAAP